MTQKELNEIRRRLKLDKNSIGTIYGCYVNKDKEVISHIDSSLGVIPENEGEKYMALFKKVLSGSLGKNLLDVAFTTQQVLESPEHKRLMSLREHALKDETEREEFFRKMIASCDIPDTNVLILAAYDTYDVPHKTKDGETDTEQESDTMFSYILCCVCPVSEGKSELGYYDGDKQFHSCTPPQTVSAPEYGFMFPAFDDRKANIYNALLYSRDASNNHPQLLDTLFKTDPPMTAPEQKETFTTVLAETLETDCRFDVLQSVHEQVRERIAEHKDSHTPEPLDFSARVIGSMLQNSGIAEDKTEAFCSRCNEQFGRGVNLNPKNLIDTSRFDVVTPLVKISVDPENSYLVETRVIDGRKYILIPADEGVEVNGVNAFIPDEE